MRRALCPPPHLVCKPINQLSVVFAPWLPHRMQVEHCVTSLGVGGVDLFLCARWTKSNVTWSHVSFMPVLHWTRPLWRSCARQCGSEPNPLPCLLLSFSTVLLGSFLPYSTPKSCTTVVLFIFSCPFFDVLLTGSKQYCFFKNVLLLK